MATRLTELNLTDKTWVRAHLGETTIRGMLATRHKSDIGRAWIIDIPGVKHRPGYDGIWLWDDEEWYVQITQPPVILPSDPGTVIAIGFWWLVRLAPYAGDGPGCWELLPARDEATRRSMERAGVKQQCVYGDEWVLAEAEQEGGFEVIARPVPNGKETP